MPAAKQSSTKKKSTTKKTTKKKTTKKKVTRKKPAQSSVEPYVSPAPGQGEIPQSDEQHGIDYRCWAAVDGFLPALFEDPTTAAVPNIGPRPEQRTSLRPQPRGFWERDELWIVCLRALQLRFRKTQIRQALSEFIAYMGYDPGVNEGQFLKCLEKARAALREEIELDSQDHVALGYETMIQVLQDPNSMPSDKIKAQQVINELLGIGSRYDSERMNETQKVALIRQLLSNDVQ